MLRSARGTIVLTSEELAAEGSATVPSTPGLDRFGYRVSHITDRFLLGGSSDAYCIWRFQSASPPIEFPVTADGWARAWAAFRRLDSGSEGAIAVSGADT